MSEWVTNKQPFGIGQELFKQGQPPRHAYLIERGKVEALIDNSPRMATATAVEPTVCVVITESLFKEHLGRATPLLKKILLTFTGNLRSMGERALGLPDPS